jgi:predicted transcriptional regulator
VKVFRAGGLGLGKLLGPLEAKLMDFLWDAGTPLLAREVHEGIDADVKYITVVTVLNNLTKKDLLQRERQGKAHVFQPLLSREEFLSSVSGDVVRGLVDLSPRIAVNSFVGVLDAFSPGEIAELQAELTRHLQEHDD